MSEGRDQENKHKDAEEEAQQRITEWAKELLKATEVCDPPHPKKNKKTQSVLFQPLFKP